MCDMGIRLQLAPEQRQNGTFLPHPCYTFSRQEKIDFCNWMRRLKFPEGYSSNIRSRVRMDGNKSVNLKSHDCHVLMQQLLPLAIEGKLQKNVRNNITRLCFFFNSLCARVVDPTIFDSMQAEIIHTLCTLEMYFPPSFFDVMVHLSIHLVHEVRMCVPVYARWMYPFERFMKVLKGSVHNHYMPEANMVEVYISEEAVKLCVEVISDMEPIGMSEKRNESMLLSGGMFGPSIKSVNSELKKQAHLYGLRNMADVVPYVKEHMRLLRRQATISRKGLHWIQNEHVRAFESWFAKKVNEELDDSPNRVPDIICWLSYGPNQLVFVYKGYVVNGKKFNTEERDNVTMVQNSGVTLTAESMHVANSKDKRPHIGSMQFNGIITDIWELDYTHFTVPVFKCKWTDSGSGICIDEMEFTIVDFSRLGHKSNSFILASQARQVFYVADPLNPKYSIVLACENAYGRGNNIEMVDDIQLFVTSTTAFERGGDDNDDEPICLGDREGTLIRKSVKGKSKMRMS